MVLRGPGSPWARFQAARRKLDGIAYAEIKRRRAAGCESDDILSMLIGARDENGQGFEDRELHDHVMTLLFAGHDTSSSTLSFLIYELARNPLVLERILDEQDRVLDGREPNFQQLERELPQLDMALAETLRLYPPVWFGPRMAVDAFEFGGYRIPPAPTSSTPRGCRIVCQMCFAIRRRSCLSLNPPNSWVVWSGSVM